MTQPYCIQTRSSAIAEGPHDALVQMLQLRIILLEKDCNR